MPPFFFESGHECDARSVSGQLPYAAAGVACHRLLQRPVLYPELHSVHHSGLRCGDWRSLCVRLLLTLEAAAALNVYYNYTGNATCNDINQQTTPALGGGWDYQSCTEMVRSRRLCSIRPV